MEDSINIAVLGNTTTDFTGIALANECKIRGIKTFVYNAPYQQYNQQIMDQTSGFYASKPDLAILQLDGRTLYPEWFRFSAFTDKNNTDLENQVQKTADVLVSLIQTIHSHSDTKIVINNFKVPYHTPAGILDNRSGMGLKRMVSSLNFKLEDFAAATDNVYVFDYNGFCSHIGHMKAVDTKMAYLTKSTLSYSATKLLAGEYMRYILPLMALNKKCLVLDLDNTLWGGIAGEDGISGVRLDLSGPGRCYYDFQEEILNLYDKGILLAVNSKNNPEDAFEIIENHPHMLLRKRFFSSIKVNWQDKAANLKEIADELNICLDSLVFFDDNPVERDYIKKTLSQVTVVDVPDDPGRYCDVLKSLPEFEKLNMTGEDRKRNEMIGQNCKRSQYQQSFQSLEEYLENLKIEITVSKADDFNIPRIAQLTQKTNQFNMTTKRYQVSDIKRLLEAGNHLVYCCSTSDKFGDNGITGCCIVRLEGTTAVIDTFLLSCRVLGRNVEYAFLAAVIKQLREMNMKRIVAHYLSTEKNKANSSFYITAGFTAVSTDECGKVCEMEETTRPLEFAYIKCKLPYAESFC
jgi:FkbH-like protein